MRMITFMSGGVKIIMKYSKEEVGWLFYENSVKPANETIYIAPRTFSRIDNYKAGNTEYFKKIFESEYCLGWNAAGTYVII